MAAETADKTSVHGEVAPGFERVREEFWRNFAERGELGAACAVYHDGEKVVDLWGGHRDVGRSEPWEEDTLVLVYATTKGLAGMAMAAAHSRGLFDHDKRVAAYWPEFAQNGKESVTVRQLLSHQAGLSALDRPLDLGTIADRDSLAGALARRRPAWEPGTRQAHHFSALHNALQLSTLGFLVLLPPVLLALIWIDPEGVRNEAACKPVGREQEA